jgi:tetratricopeptide (TPR) repeat protein
LGWLEWNLRSPRRARRYLSQALSICRQIEERWGEAVVLNNLGIAHLDGGERRRALERFEQAYEIIASLENEELKLENLVYRAVARAAKIKDPALKGSFFSGDRSHREIIEAWRDLNR